MQEREGDKYLPNKNGQSAYNKDSSKQTATSIKIEEWQDQVTSHRDQNLQVPPEDGFDSASSVNATMVGSGESRALEPEGTHVKATAHDHGNERIKGPASLQNKKWNA
ncbi:hypothetical protein DPMN_043800 [Dreissena polymorpha]|uniref:Uncharacterized protein n=1 Tax=Dreissena polymorpha TaxID=45954 RepID=A0A9D4D192_DREPO|nr:hypothetical protein DPMN_043800 [Dreissena polymorpha]